MTHKKQLFNLFEDIAHINATVWDNPKYSYDDATESAYQIEEALEGLTSDGRVYTDLVSYTCPKSAARGIINRASGGEDLLELTDVDRFDKALDAIYFAVGSLHKLGLDPSQMVDGLAVVHQANKQKSGTKDAEGKVGKPTDFVQPEPLLQAILDKRTLRTD